MVRLQRPSGPNNFYNIGTFCYISFATASQSRHHHIEHLATFGFPCIQWWRFSWRHFVHRLAGCFWRPPLPSRPIPLTVVIGKDPTICVDLNVFCSTVMGYAYGWPRLSAIHVHTNDATTSTYLQGVRHRPTRYVGMQPRDLI